MTYATEIPESGGHIVPDTLHFFGSFPCTRSSSARAWRSRGCGRRTGASRAPTAGCTGAL